MRYLQRLSLAVMLTGGVAGYAQTTPVYTYTVPAGGYAANGNIVAYSDSVTGTWSMQYDNLNRLHAAAASSGTFQGVNLVWQYDSFGNRLSQTPGGNSAAPLPSATSATYQTNNQMQSSSAGAAPTYDAAGNVSFDGAATYVAYDGESRVCATYSTIGSSGVTQYIYNAEGQRVAKGRPLNNPTNALFCPTDRSNFVVTAVYVLGHSGEQLTELDGSGNWQHTNVYNGGQLLATYDSRGLHFPQTDPLGTVRLQASASGAEEQRCTSLPFGDGLNCTGIADPTQHHYTGKERDAESGLDNFGARYFGSSMGRFMSPDPGSASGFEHMGDPQGWNGYAYARNNPLLYSDPDGENYHICDQNGQNCSDVSDKDFDQIRQNAVHSGEQWNNGNITLADGSAGGKFTQTDIDLPGDPTSNQAGLNVIGTASATVGSIKGVAAFYGASALGGAGVYGAGVAIGSMGAGAGAVPSIIAPLLPAVPSAIEKLQRIGVSLQQANQIVNSPAAQHVVDNLRDGNVNNYQTINGQIIRITTDPTGQRIISAGIVQTRNIAAGMASGRFTPVP